MNGSDFLASEATRLRWEPRGWATERCIHEQTGRIVGRVVHARGGFEAWTEAVYLGTYSQRSDAIRAVERALRAEQRETPNPHSPTGASRQEKETR